MPAGLAFREGKKGDNFGDTAPFLLHTVKKGMIYTYDFKMTSEMQAWRKSLYMTQSYNPDQIYSKNGISIKYVETPNFYQT